MSWFWLVGAVALSLLPTLIKDRLGGIGRRRHPGAGDFHGRHCASGSLGGRARKPRAPEPGAGAARRLADGLLLARLWRSSRGAPAGVAAEPGRADVLASVSGLAADRGDFLVCRSRAASSSCRRLPPCSPGRQPSGARASFAGRQRAVGRLHGRRQPGGGRAAGAWASGVGLLFAAAGARQSRRRRSRAARLGPGRRAGCRALPVQVSSAPRSEGRSRTCRAPGSASSSRRTTSACSMGR